MSDIKLIELEDLSYDIQIQNNALVMDDTLRTSLIISLFTDRRVSAEELPVGEQDRKGWWGDELSDDDDQIGSKLWLLKREKVTPEVIARAKTYCEEALAWMIDDQIAKSVTVITERSGLDQISIGIEIERPQDDRIRYKYGFIWRL